jgi:hypothetical protein
MEAGQGLADAVSLDFSVGFSRSAGAAAAALIAFGGAAEITELSVAIHPFFNLTGFRSGGRVILWAKRNDRLAPNAGLR